MVGDKNFERDFRLFASDKGVSNTTIDKFKKNMFVNYLNPTILEERQLNVTQMDVFSRLFMDGILYLGDSIDNNVANVLTSQMLYLQTQNDEQDIKLYINSPGGSVYAGLAIYDTMQFIPNKVSTMCTGMAASMASILLCGGEKGQRFALPHSRVLLHQPMGGVGYGTQASDIKIHCDEILKLKNELFDIISEHSGQSFEQIEKDADRDFWLTAKEATEYGKFGLIDKIVVKE